MQQGRKQRKDLTQRTHQTGPHQITDTFRQNMTKTGPLKCRLTGNFQKPSVIAYYQMGRKLSETGCYILRKLNEISNHHIDAYLSSFSMFFFIRHTHLYRI